IGVEHVGFVDGTYVLNQNLDELKNSALDLVVAGTQKAVLMVESEAKELTEDQMLGAVLFGHREMQAGINAINEFAAEVGTPRWEWQAPQEDVARKNAIVEEFGAQLNEAYRIINKQERYAKVGEVKAAAIEAFATDAEGAPSKDHVGKLFHDIEYRVVRDAVLEGRRIDGRALDQVRAIDTVISVLPKTHGSALFTRGETQAIVVATLGGM